MPDMKYDSDTLRQGGQQNRLAGDSAESAGNAVRSAPVSASPFGNVSPAGSLAGALSHAQQEHAKGARTAATNRDARARRVDTTARAGDELTAVTTAVARSGTARQVARGME